MSRIIWRRVRSEWVGKVTADGPDRFSVAPRKDGPFVRTIWTLRDLQTSRVGAYDRLREAKSAAETLK